MTGGHGKVEHAETSVLPRSTSPSPTHTHDH